MDVIRRTRSPSRSATRFSHLVLGSSAGKNMKFTIVFEREDDGRWLAEVLEPPGVLAYEQTSNEAIAKVQALALRALADRA